MKVKKIVKQVILWFVVAILMTGVLTYFPSPGSLLLLLAAVFVAPIPKVQNFLAGKGLRGAIKVVLTVVVFLAGTTALPNRTAANAQTLPDVMEEESVVSDVAAGEVDAIPTSKELEPDPQPDSDATEAARLEEEARQAEQARLEEEARQAEQARLEEEARQAAEQARLEEEARQAEEAARLEEEARQAEQARLEEEARQAEEAAKQQSSSKSSGNAANFDTYDNPDQQKTTDTYVLNISSKKIHKPTCRDVKKIAPKNYSTSSESIATLKSRGYTTCGHCNPS